MQEETNIRGFDEIQEDVTLTPDEFTNDMKIDQFRLDEECLTQTILAPKYGFLLAQLTAERDHLKRRMKVIRANVERDVRKDPEAYGLSKATDAAVASILEANEEVGRAEEDLINKNYEVNMAMVAVDSVAARKKLLEGLIQLTLGQYYSTPKGDIEKAALEAGGRSHRDHIGKALAARKVAPHETPTPMRAPVETKTEEKVQKPPVTRRALTVPGGGK